jgi:hypothetical protein
MAVRRVRRIVRRIDPWTVLKVSLVFNAVAGLIFVLGTWVTWSLVLRRGIPERIVDIFESLTLTITIEGELYFRIVVLLAIIGAILMTAFMTLGALLYNLIADLVGGIEIAVLEETYRPASTRTSLKPASVDVPAAEAAPFFAPAAPSEVLPDHQERPDRDLPIEVPAATQADGEAGTDVPQEPLSGDVPMEPAAPKDDGPKLGEGEVSRVRTA